MVVFFSSFRQVRLLTIVFGKISSNSEPAVCENIFSNTVCGIVVLFLHSFTHVFIARGNSNTRKKREKKKKKLRRISAEVVSSQIAVTQPPCMWIYGIMKCTHTRTQLGIHIGVHTFMFIGGGERAILSCLSSTVSAEWKTDTQHKQREQQQHQQRKKINKINETQTWKEEYTKGSHTHRDEQWYIPGTEHRLYRILNDWNIQKREKNQIKTK